MTAPPPKPWERSSGSSAAGGPPKPWEVPSSSTTAVGDSSLAASRAQPAARPWERQGDTNITALATTSSSYMTPTSPYASPYSRGGLYGNTSMYGSAGGYPGVGGYGGTYGSNAYGSSMYGTGGAYGSNMYGGYRGGMGMGMYGSPGMYGNSSMYSSGSMYGAASTYGANSLGMYGGMAGSPPLGSPADPNMAPPHPPNAWQAFLNIINGAMHFFGRLSFLVDENTHAVHFFISALLQLLDRAGSLYGEIARFVLRLIFRRRAPAGKAGMATGKALLPAPDQLPLLPAPPVDHALQTLPAPPAQALALPADTPPIAAAVGGGGWEHLWGPRRS